MKKLYIALLAGIITTTGFAQTTQMIGSTEVGIDTLTSTMSFPWEIQLENDDFLWVTERIGLVSRVETVTGEKTVVLDIRNQIVTNGESGLLGMALHPAFSVTPEVFLVYTHGPVDANGRFFERLVKYTFDGDDSLKDPVTLIDNIPAYSNHDGSRLFVMPDQTLLMSTGETGQDMLAQDSTSLAGKYLRVNFDGSIPVTNPDSTSYIYTMGHRNSQGIAILPDSTIIISEHGPTADDEISILEAGKNYGWPLIHGFCDEPFENTPCATGLYQEPIYHWSPTIATSDLVYYQNPYFPEWDERLLLTTLNGKRLVTLKLNANEDGVSDEDQYFLNQFGRLRDIAVSSDKKIYIATNTGPGDTAHPIIRITTPYFVSVTELEQVPFVIYPNPASDYVTIDLALQDATIRILDLNGREVMNMKHVESNNKISLVNLQQGFYMLEVSQAGMAPTQQRLQKI